MLKSLLILISLMLFYVRRRCLNNLHRIVSLQTELLPTHIIMLWIVFFRLSQPTLTLTFSLVWLQHRTSRSVRILHSMQNQRRKWLLLLRLRRIWRKIKQIFILVSSGIFFYWFSIFFSFIIFIEVREISK